MTDNETQADIAVEMRTYFQTQKRNGNPEHRPWHQVLSDWADRIEARHPEWGEPSTPHYRLRLGELVMLYDK